MEAPLSKQQYSRVRLIQKRIWRAARYLPAVYWIAKLFLMWFGS